MARDTAPSAAGWAGFHEAAKASEWPMCWMENSELREGLAELDGPDVRVERGPMKQEVGARFEK
jgi:hypothetical protein